ncbi:hypothetical protein GCM10010232_62020 [Streptomyces amakusaensis]|uniref:Lipoprotein CseA n=1 Tax=Streptomyces amakusaensis TaxID=67271 RepID=A0ABW0AW11_9ACTN
MRGLKGPGTSRTGGPRKIAGTGPGRAADGRPGTGDHPGGHPGRHPGLHPGGLTAGAAALAALAVLGLFTVGCSASGSGVQDEGSAHAQAAPKSTPAASSPGAAADTPAGKTAAVDPVELIKNDPEVDKQVKADLKPCGRSAYPVDVAYGNITGGESPDVVVNVMTCADGVGLGTYVYRAAGSAYKNVFKSEKTAVYASIDRGDLVVTQQVYSERDPVASPSAEVVTTYHWASGRFSELHWVRNEFSRTVGEDELVVPEPTSAPNEN